MKVRTRYSRSSEKKSWKPGEVMDLPDGQAQRLLDEREADPYLPGEPDWMPPVDWGNRHVVMMQNNAGPASAPAAVTASAGIVASDTAPAPAASNEPGPSSSTGVPPRPPMRRPAPVGK